MISIAIILFAAPKTVVPPANVVVNAAVIQNKGVSNLVPGISCVVIIATGTFETNWLNRNIAKLKITNVLKSWTAWLIGFLTRSVNMLDFATASIVINIPAKKNKTPQSALEAIIWTADWKLSTGFELIKIKTTADAINTVHAGTSILPILLKIKAKLTRIITPLKRIIEFKSSIINKSANYCFYYSKEWLQLRGLKKQIKTSFQGFTAVNENIKGIE